jgi:hypothetical protein
MSPGDCATHADELARVPAAERSAPFARHAPDHVADIVRHQRGSVRTDRDTQIEAKASLLFRRRYGRTD